jgi:hypothetical protein
MAFGPIPLNQDVVTHLRRLGHASSAGEVIKELQWLAPNLGRPAMLSEWTLSSLAALAEAHLRERFEPSHDPLTGTLDAEAFQELWHAHALRASSALHRHHRHRSSNPTQVEVSASEDVSASSPAQVVQPVLTQVEAARTQVGHDADWDCAPIAIVLSLLDGADPRRSGQAPAELRTLAAICTEHVAADDYVGRVAQGAIAVLPRHGGLRGAQSVRNRLLDACRSQLAHLGYPIRLEVQLRDVTGAMHECTEEILGTLPVQ